MSIGAFSCPKTKGQEMLIKGYKVPPRFLPSYPEWTLQAECAKYPIKYVEEVFFDYNKNARKIQQAKAICAVCPVIRQCYRTNREVPMGIFYGMTAIERWRERGLKGYPSTSKGFTFWGRRNGGMKEETMRN